MTGPWLSPYDKHLLREGRHYRSFEKLGAHATFRDGMEGVHFAVWAPNAAQVSVVGDFNGWEHIRNPLALDSESGIWQTFIPELASGTLYKYSLLSRDGGYHALKADPYAFRAETPPHSASVIWDINRYNWHDETWMAQRLERASLLAPLTIYEVHLGSWMHSSAHIHRPLTYRELAHKLPQYVRDLGFTHVALLPLAEHTIEDPWGSQTIGFFAPTSRYGTPEDLMYLIDMLHQHNVGVLLDWKAFDFPAERYGLSMFDGTALYEHPDPALRVRPDVGTLVFNHARPQVTNFLLSSALFWLERYHFDGLRLGDITPMLHLDHGRAPGAWTPNRFGGGENVDAIAFLKTFNETVYGSYPDVITIAEEKSAWPLVSRPTYLGGLGFGFKWNVGWMHDVLSYMSKDPVYRCFHHNSLTFGLLYAFHENFILPLSHDEVSHGRQSLLAKMPGDSQAKFANARAMLGFMYGHPGKKLLAMGTEIGSWLELDARTPLDWNLLEQPAHRGLQQWIADLNRLVANETALHEVDFDPHGFQWVDCNDSLQSVLTFFRRGKGEKDAVLCVLNFTPVTRYNYRVGVWWEGYWEELLNSDAEAYGGSGVGNLGGVSTEREPAHGQSNSLSLTLPPLSALFFRLT